MDAIANASPSASAAEVDDVGTIPWPASFTSGIYNFISAALYNVEFFFDDGITKAGDPKLKLKLGSTTKLVSFSPNHPIFL